MPILIPPSIAGGAPGETKKVVVTEGAHLKLTCIATGIPRPVITWAKLDHMAFPDGNWRSQNNLSSF